jgi:DNA repair protein RecN (Recombination protein N)
VLAHLQIANLAIIDAVELEFGAGLTALTGETGAGKSILVDAVMLATGARAGSDLVRHGAERAEIAATFTVTGNPEARAWLDAQSVDEDGEVTLRRVLGADGRSRCYVNGQLQPAQAVRELGALLIDIHGQQEFLSLLRPGTQRRVLDEHGGHQALLEPVERLAEAWRVAQAERDRLRAAAAVRGSRLELLRYQTGELEALALGSGEVAALVEERARVANLGRLAEAARGALALTYDGDGAEAHALVSRALSTLRAVQEFDARLRAVAPLLDEAGIALKEAAAQLADYLDALEVDPARQDQLERRLAAIEDLARKHRVDAQELPAVQVALAAELAELERSEVVQGELDARIAGLERDWRAAAARLSQARCEAATRLTAAVTELMRVLGMPGGQFAIAVLPAADASPAACGADAVEFQVSANPGVPPKSLARVASGGELSRISLAVQVAAADSRPGACMIFDEVDAGVGGGVAEMVGRQLATLAARGQVLCVTHLAQVASQADHHVRVAKLSDGRSSRTTITELGVEERVEELARMLGGVDITRTARDHAREMLRSRGSRRARRR